MRGAEVQYYRVLKQNVNFSNTPIFAVLVALVVGVPLALGVPLVALASTSSTVHEHGEGAGSQADAHGDPGSFYFLLLLAYYFLLLFYYLLRRFH